jgi:hypothetical protein
MVQQGAFNGRENGGGEPGEFSTENVANPGFESHPRGVVPRLPCTAIFDDFS